MSRFVAIDFETASYTRDSACSIGMVVVADGKIAHKEHYLICPPSPDFAFTHIHGLTWNDVKDAPGFDKLWPRLRGLLEGADFLAAHNASFDRGVLGACCNASGLLAPALPFVCTVQLARAQWGIFPTKLPNVCAELGIRLRHHDALSDAEACARIVLAAQKEGWRFGGV
jgi:DNA polymerase-3 subunit epsilon